MPSSWPLPSHTVAAQQRRARGGGPYGTELVIPPQSGAYPVATFLVNVVGAVILGAFAALPAGWLPAHELAKPAIGTGFCGGLTTFSTMSLETYERFPASPAVGAAYAATSVLAAPACAWAGFALMQNRRAASKGRAPPGPPERKKT